MTQHRLAAALLAVAGVIAATPAAASSISVDMYAGGCAQSSLSAPAAVLLTAQYATVPIGSACAAGTERVGVASVSLASVKISFVSTDAGFGNANSIYGRVNVLDSLTITGGSGTGTLLMVWAVEGSLNASGYSYADFAFDSPTVGGGFLESVCDRSVNTLCSSPVTTLSFANRLVTFAYPFTFGTPFPTQLQVIGGLGTLTIFNRYGDGGPGAGTVDFFNTASLQPLVIYDAAGKQVAGTATSDSGFQYQVAALSAVAVPESGTLVLFASGLVGLAVLRRRLSRS